MHSMCVGGNWGHCYFTVFHTKPSGRSRDYSLKQTTTWVDVLEGVLTLALYSCVRLLHMCKCELSSFLSTYSSNIAGVAGRVEMRKRVEDGGGRGGVVVAEL